MISSPAARITAPDDAAEVGPAPSTPLEIEAAFDRFGRSLYRYVVVRVGGDSRLADDVMQQVWLGALRSGRSPPRGISRRLLEYFAAYDLQSKAFGGLRPTVRRKLRQISQADGLNAQSAGPVAKTKSLAPGSRLVREWRGRTYTVDVLEQGFRCDGEQYRSLSQVAHAITGARWSGPRFFGL